jgi:long-chain acyl-CoA synthetase
LNVKSNPAFWPEDVPKSIEYPEIPLSEILRRSAKKYPDNPAIIFMDNKITYKTLDELTDRFATALTALGVQKGDKEPSLCQTCLNSLSPSMKLFESVG